MKALKTVRAACGCAEERAFSSDNVARRPMRIDLIALDLDGTLLEPDETISERNRAAIRHSLDSGVRVVLVTGRGTDLPIRISRDLNLNLPVICCHGALTKDFGANRTLVHLPLAMQYAKPMVEYAETHGLSLAIYSEETFYRLEGSRVFMDDMTGPSWREAKTFADVLHEAPTFVRFLGAESVRAMAREFGDWPLNFRYETWGDFYECAVLNREASKKTALARLCADFQIVPERVLAIGDSRNDVPMLRWAGVGVAMGNALPEVKESVRYVTASNTDDGVARAIERFVGIPAKRPA
jgi:Cof subfamily protein (haloacid dehalogenase superfamily)